MPSESHSYLYCNWWCARLTGEIQFPVAAEAVGLFTSNQLRHEWCIMGWMLKHNCCVFWAVLMAVDGEDTLTTAWRTWTHRSLPALQSTHQWTITNETPRNTHWQSRQNNQKPSSPNKLCYIWFVYNMEYSRYHRNTVMCRSEDVSVNRSVLYLKGEEKNRKWINKSKKYLGVVVHSSVKHTELWLIFSLILGFVLLTLAFEVTSH